MRLFSIIVVQLLLVILISCGSNTTGPDDNSSNPPSNNSLKATLSSIQAKVFSPTCALSSCHGGSRSPDLRSGNSYSSLVNKPSSQVPSMMLVKPGDSANSYLMKKLNGDGTSLMPKNGSRLAQATIDSIAAWIDAGAKNN